MTTTTTTTTKALTSKTPPILRKRTSTKSAPPTDMWKQIELRIQENLDNFEATRKYCAYCGRGDNFENLARCYGCQMVYYCSQEHQLHDWLEHMQKCAELEWVALGELIQSIPAPPSICELGQYWSKSILDVQTWTDWFDMRPQILKIARNTAKIFDNIKNINKKREPSYEDIIDGLLAAVTDSMTYSLTVGNTLVKIGINPCVRPVCIHCLHSTNDFDLKNIDLIKKQFYELCNMFPGCKGFEIVFIGTDINTNEINEPYMKMEQKYLPRNQLMYISGWHGTYTNYIKYQCQIEGYSLPDLIVSFHPNFTSSPYKLINEWTDDLKVTLINNFPCLFTFYDSEERQKAFNTLTAFQTNLLYAQLNQFSSLLMKQLVNKPNHVYANNSHFIIIRGFIDTELDSRFKQQQQQQQHSSQQQPQQHACIQTVGVNEPDNQSLRHVNGKLHLNIDRETGTDEFIVEKIAYRPSNFLKQIPLSPHQPPPPPIYQTVVKSESINDNNLKKFLNSGFATPSSETSGSYYQPRLNLTLGTSHYNIDYTNDHDSTDEPKCQRQKHHHHHHRSKMQKSKSLQKLEFRQVNDDFEDEEDDSVYDNNEPVVVTVESTTIHYNTLPAPKPRNYGTLGNSASVEAEDRPPVKPRLPKPKPRTILSSNSDDAVPELVNQNLVHTNSVETEKVPEPPKVVKTVTRQESLSHSSTPTSPTVIAKAPAVVILKPKPMPVPTASSRSPTLSNSTSASSNATTTTTSSTNGFVSQMKSMFEQQLKNSDSPKAFVTTSKSQIQNLTAKLASSTSSPLFKPVVSGKSSFKEYETENHRDQKPIEIPIERAPPPMLAGLETNDYNNNQSEYMNIDHLMDEKFQTIEELNNSALKHQQQQAMLSEFRPFDCSKSYELQQKRSITPSNKSLTLSMGGSNGLFIKHIPDPIDVVNLKFEGERRVLVPGYLTSADILRNSLISTTHNTSEDNGLSLKEMLRQQQMEAERVSRVPPTKANLTTSTATHMNSNKHEMYERQSMNQTRLPLEIGNNSSIFQKVARDEYVEKKRTEPQVAAPPPPPPPLPTSFSKLTPPALKQQQQPVASPLPKLPQSPPPPVPAHLLKQQTTTPPTRPTTLSPSKNTIQPVETIKSESEDKYDDLYSSSLRSRSKSMSGVLKLDDKKSTVNKSVINFDLIDDDYSFEPSKPPITITELPQSPIKTIVQEAPPKIEIQPQPKIEDLLPKLEMPAVDTQSISTTTSDYYEYKAQTSPKKIYTPVRQPPPPPTAPPPIPTQKKQQTAVSSNDQNHYAVSQLVPPQRKESVSGVFDPSDFDSFDEAENTFCSTRTPPPPPTSQSQSTPPQCLPKIEMSASPVLTTFQSPATTPTASPTKKLVDDKTTTGSFDPNDFDSFDEDERESLEPPLQKPQQQNENQSVEISNSEEYNLKYFNNNNNKLNSFKSTPKQNSNFFRNALNRLSTSNKSDGKKRSSSVPPSKLLSELDRKGDEDDDSPKQQKRVPEEANGVNLKTLQLMNKMQIEHEEKQKRRKLRLLRQQQEQQQQKQEQEQPKTPKSEKKFLNSLMSSLFNKDNTSSSYEQQVSVTTTTTTTTTTVNLMEKNENKRLSLRKLKAKDKAKKQTGKGDGEYTSDGEMQNGINGLSTSSQSLNFYRNPDDDDENDSSRTGEGGENENNFAGSSYIRSASFDTSSLQRVGKIQSAADLKSPNKIAGNEKLDLMQQIKAELDEEIKARYAVENANKTFNSSTSPQKHPPQQQQRKSRQEKRSFESDTANGFVSSSNESNSLRINSSRKIRSKSVTFLDEITTDDEVLNSSQNNRNSLNFGKGNNNSSSQNPDESYSGNEYNNNTQTPNSTMIKRKAQLKTGDIRYHCGALTGIGPIRSIMKKSATDLSITLNTPLNPSENLPHIELNLLNISTSPQMSPHYQQQHHSKQQSPIKSKKKVQSDL